MSGEVIGRLPYGFPKLLVSSARPALLAELAGKTDVILIPPSSISLVSMGSRKGC